VYDFDRNCLTKIKMIKKMPIPWGKVALIVWLTLTTLYVVFAEYSRLNMFVAQNAYNQGYRDSVTQLLAEVAKCQPVPVNFDGKTTQVIGLDCLQAPPAESDADAVTDASVVPAN